MPFIDSVAADMTLNLTLINWHGAWQCSDHRVSIQGRPVDDAATKHIVLRCRDGAALIAYSGVGRKGDVEPSEWMAGILRGDDRTLDESLILLRDASTRDLGPIAAPAGIRHMFTVAAFFRGGPWLLQIRNFQDLASPPRRNFESSCRKVSEGGGAVSSFGQLLPVSLESRKLLEGVAQMRPRRTEDFHGLLEGKGAAHSNVRRGHRTFARSPKRAVVDCPRFSTHLVGKPGRRRRSQRHRHAGARAEGQPDARHGVVQHVVNPSIY